ncbi:MBL fold metallo-hydrolase [Candidatus Bipolaricaulota bacterium]|nr:MBL fold metallo-hydrolase [Candidatus Bipolaricaulota bacterium]
MPQTHFQWGLLVFLLMCLAVLSSALAAWTAPQCAGMPLLITDEGGVFAPLDLDALVQDPEYTVAELAWRITEAGAILVAVVGHTAYFAAPHTDWFGSDKVVLEVCNPAGECSTCGIDLEVMPVNDPPSLALPHQIATDQGVPFASIDLAEYATDIDDPDSALEWSVEGQRNLEASIRDGALFLAALDENWFGVEDLTIRVCDTAGACAEGVVQVAVADEDALTIRLIDNAGFQLRWHDVGVMIDAVYKDPASRFPEILTATPPFDADVLLFTHSHPDHFDPDAVAQYMAAQPTALLVAPQDAVDRVLQIDPALANRSTDVVLERDSYVSLEPRGIPLTMYDFPHGGTLNISYLVQLGTHKVFHSGDVLWAQSELCRLLALYDIAGEQLSVALLVPRFFSTAQFREQMRDYVNAIVYVPIHVKPGSFSYYVGVAAQEQDILVMDRLLETWVIPSP